jgi:sortase (surface protein transpeptidase)
VLAAHIAFDNRTGVFRRLSSIEVGDRFSVVFDDGTVRKFEIFEVDQYDKQELPFDRIFAKEGDPVVALISCGGEFNRSLGSYDDNIVAYGRPI